MYSRVRNKRPTLNKRPGWKNFLEINKRPGHLLSEKASNKGVQGGIFRKNNLSVHGRLLRTLEYLIKARLLSESDF